MSKILLGNTPTLGFGERDATHVACICVCSDVNLLPGQSLKIVPNSAKVEPCEIKERHGIVDPFLTETVMSGTPFYALIEQKFVSELTHQFTVNLESKDSSYPQNVYYEENIYYGERWDDNDDDGFHTSRCRIEGC
jgi:hypothetical protein